MPERSDFLVLIGCGIARGGAVSAWSKPIQGGRGSTQRELDRLRLESGARTAEEVLSRRIRPGLHLDPLQWATAAERLLRLNSL